MHTKHKERSKPAKLHYYETNEKLIVFITVCTKDRKTFLNNENSHSLLQSVWKNSTAWLIGRYVIMPDHIHLFATPGYESIPLSNWVTYWKSQFTKQFQSENFRWQSGYWDTKIRNYGHYEEKWNYVKDNPVRHGFVSNASEWRFQGCIHDLSQ